MHSTTLSEPDEQALDPRYHGGQIYRISSTKTDAIYIGSTFQELEDRLRGHVQDGGRCSSSVIIALGSYEITRVSLYPCNNKTALDREEGWWVRQFRKEGYVVVNKYMPGAVAAAGGKAAYHVAWGLQNKEAVKERNKKYNSKNREKLAERQKARY